MLWVGMGGHRSMLMVMGTNSKENVVRLWCEVIINPNFHALNG